jgi:hypothetical protein
VKSVTKPKPERIILKFWSRCEGTPYMKPYWQKQRILNMWRDCDFPLQPRVSHNGLNAVSSYNVWLLFAKCPVRILAETATMTVILHGSPQSRRMAGSNLKSDHGQSLPQTFQLVIGHHSFDPKCIYSYQQHYFISSRWLKMKPRNTAAAVG